MTKFSFWLIPENDLYQELEQVIVENAEKSSSPVFVPHVTLHGPVVSTDKQVVVDVRRAISEIKPFEVQVGDAEFSTTYFQCVFARIRTSAELLNAHLALRNSLGVEEDHVFMPHASLVYGDFDMKIRERIAKEIKLKITHFMASKITIVRADSADPKEWGVVDEVGFKL
jgi:2'-5' RNA ligase